MDDAHAHADLEWNYLIQGSMRYHTGGRELVLPARRLLLFWAGLPHRSHHPSRDAEMVVGVLPLAQFLAWGLDRSALDRLLSGTFLLGPVDGYGDDERLLRRWCGDLAGGDPRRRAVVLLELRSRFARLLATEAEPAVTTIPSPAVAGLLDRLVAGHRSRVSVEAAARSAGMNAKYAYTAVRRHTGFTPRGFLEAFRVAQAQRRLIAGDSVAQAASVAGFASARTFHTAFLAQVGTSPAAWRRAVVQPAAET